MRTLPKVDSLRTAVQTVIKSNKDDKYHPNYFAQIVANTNDSHLVQTCTGLITSPSSLSAMITALEKHPNLLFLEDFVSLYGIEWGFSEETVEVAKQRVQSFDVMVNHKRYE